MAHFNQAFTLPAGLSVIGGTVDFNITSYVKLPTGTTAQRHAAPPNFAMRGNSETGLVEYYNNGRWNSIASGESGDEALLLTLIMT